MRTVTGWCPALVDRSTAQLLHSKLRKHYRRRVERFYEPEDLEVFCETVSPRDDRETETSSMIF